ncbi:hypothetical protein BaRGS_00024701, partial [Batillaria attramentaria]
LSFHFRASILALTTVNKRTPAYLKSYHIPERGTTVVRATTYYNEFYRSREICTILSTCVFDMKTILKPSEGLPNPSYLALRNISRWLGART